jgi:OOP family OmpA-OmpF porin
MKLTASLLAAISAASLSLSAWAADGSASGIYVNVDLGRSNVSSQVYEDSGDPASSLAIGYTFNRFFSVEAYVSSLSFKLLDSMFGDSSYYPSSHVGLAVASYLPLNNQLRLFGRLGAGTTTMHAGFPTGSSYNRTDYTVGAGVMYDITPTWSSRLGATRYTESKLSTVLVGFEYRF